jgi:uncharacterized OsmC-like protein
MNEVTARSLEGFRHEIVAGAHRLFADEPAPIGTDTAPAPRELLLAALAACSAMTMRLYAERKGWPLGAVTVRVRYEVLRRGEARDFPPDETRDEVERLTKTIAIEGPLDAAQKARLLEIAGRCPVHRTIAGRPRIVDTLAP